MNADDLFVPWQAFFYAFLAAFVSHVQYVPVWRAAMLSVAYAIGLVTTHAILLAVRGAWRRRVSA